MNDEKLGHKVTYYCLYCLTTQDGKQELRDTFTDIQLMNPDKKDSSVYHELAKKQMNTELKELHKQNNFTILRISPEYISIEGYRRAYPNTCPDKEPEDTPPANITRN